MKKKSSRKLPTAIYYLLLSIISIIYYILSLPVFRKNRPKSRKNFPVFRKVKSGNSEQVVRKFGKFVRKNGYNFLSVRKFGTFWIPQFRIKSQVGKLLDLYLFIQPSRLSQLGQVRSLPL